MIMKSPLTNWPASVTLLLLGLACNQQAYSVNQVEYADLAIQHPAPVIKVTGKDGKYTTASSDSLKFNALAKGRCTWANRYLSAYHRISEPGHQAQHVSDYLAHNVLVSSHDGFKNKDRTWSSSMKPISINWKPNKEIRDAAVKSCNDKRAHLVQTGKTPTSSFEGTTLVNRLTQEFSFTCSTLVSGTPFQTKNVVRSQPVKVLCDKLEPARAKFVAPKLAIKHVAVKADPKNYKGQCPAEMKFKGTVNTMGPGGKLQYRFLINGKPISTFKDLTIKPGTQSTNAWLGKKLEPQNVPNNQQQGNGQLQVNNGGMQALPQMGMAPTDKVTFEVRDGNNKRSAQDSYSINCQTKTAEIKKATVAVLNKPDLTSRGGISIGSVSGAWGQTKGADDSSRRVGKAKAQGFNSRLRKGGVVLHTKPNQAINDGKHKKITGNILLKAGNYALDLAIDDAKSVAESNENNNNFSVNLQVPNSCGLSR